MATLPSLSDLSTGATSAISAVAGLSAAGTLVGSLTNLVLASPQTTQGYQPQNPPDPATGMVSLLGAPPALLFHYEGEQSVSLQSDITDHFLEDNTSVQDQISIKPIVISTHGFIGELNNVPPFPLSALQSAANGLTSIGSYVPALSITAQIAYAEAFAAYQLIQSGINSAVSAVSSLTGSGGESVIGASQPNSIQKVANQNKQQTYFQQFYGYWYNRTLFTVQTPWAIFQNMAILTLRAIQDSQTRMITDFEVTFKQINIASTAGGGINPQGFGRNGTASASPSNAGTNALNPGGPTVAAGVTGMGGQ